MGRVLIRDVQICAKYCFAIRVKGVSFIPLLASGMGELDIYPPNIPVICPCSEAHLNILLGNEEREVAALAEELGIDGSKARSYVIAKMYILLYTLH